MTTSLLATSAPPPFTTSALMTVASTWTAAPPGAHIFSTEEVMELRVHQANTCFDAIHADIMMIRNFILDGQRTCQLATTRPVLPTFTQITLPAPSVGFSTATTIDA
jgi:hypothetical protein